MGESFPDESGNTSVKHAVITALLVFDIVPQPFESCERDVGGGFKGSLINGIKISRSNFKLTKAPYGRLGACD